MTKDAQVGINWLEDIQKLIRDRVEFGDVSLVALDSLNGLYALTTFTNARKELFHFFGFLREIDVTSFLIAEATPLSPGIGEHGVEQFLSDGIFRGIAHGSGVSPGGAGLSFDRRGIGPYGGKIGYGGSYRGRDRGILYRDRSHPRPGHTPDTICPGLSETELPQLDIPWKE